MFSVANGGKAKKRIPTFVKLKSKDSFDEMNTKPPQAGRAKLLQDFYTDKLQYITHHNTTILHTTTIMLRENNVEEIMFINIIPV